VAPAWLQAVAKHYPTLLVVDNHYAIGGLFDRFAATLAAHPVAGLRLRQAALERVPDCGTAGEVLAAHGMDADGLATRVRELLS